MTLAPGKTGVRRNTDMTATFSEEMDGDSLSSSTVTPRKSSSSTSVLTNVSYNPSTTTDTLHPSSELKRGVTYVATIEGGSGGARGLVRNALVADEVWSFKARR